MSGLLTYGNTASGSPGLTKAFEGKESTKLLDTFLHSET